jgi:hypothetical protein
MIENVTRDYTLSLDRSVVRSYIKRKRGIKLTSDRRGYNSREALARAKASVRVPSGNKVDGSPLASIRMDLFMVDFINYELRW